MRRELPGRKAAQALKVRQAHRVLKERKAARERRVLQVRRARRAGELCRFSITVSVSAAATTACFQLSCTGDSSELTIRVPI